MVYDPSTLDQNVVATSLQNQITAGITVPSPTVCCPADESCALITQDEVNDHNNRLVNIIKLCPEFLTKGYYHALSSDHPYLLRHAAAYPEWAIAGVMLVDHDDDLTVYNNESESTSYQIWKDTRVHIFTGLIYLFNEHYLGIENGLQKMINDICINSIGGITLNDEQAYLQIKEWSHLHNINTITDSNPTNGVFETKKKNKDRWLCQNYPWLICRCTVSCIQGPFMAREGWFEEEVEMEMVRSCGWCPGGTESEVRQELVQKVQGWYRRNDEPPPPYLTGENVMELKYPHLEGMRPRYDLNGNNEEIPGFMSGYECPTQGLITYEEVIIGEKFVPSELLAEMKRKMQVLTPVKTRVSDPDDDNDSIASDDAVVMDNDLPPPKLKPFDQAKVDLQNHLALCAAVTIPSLMIMGSDGKIVTASNHTRAGNNPGPTKEE